MQTPPTAPCPPSPAGGHETEERPSLCAHTQLLGNRCWARWSNGGRAAHDFHAHHDKQTVSKALMLPTKRRVVSHQVSLLWVLEKLNIKFKSLNPSVHFVALIQLAISSQVTKKMQKHCCLPYTFKIKLIRQLFICTKYANIFLNLPLSNNRKVCNVFLPVLR